jgi:hypothetical protein
MTLRHPLSCEQNNIVLWNNEEEKQDDAIHTTSVLTRTPRGNEELPENRGSASISLVREQGLGQRPPPSLLPHWRREAPTRSSAWLPGELCWLQETSIQRSLFDSDDTAFQAPFVRTNVLSSQHRDHLFVCALGLVWQTRAGLRAHLAP